MATLKNNELVFGGETPFVIHPAVINEGDVDLMTNPGIYPCYGSTHAPFGGWQTIITIPYASNDTYQSHSHQFALDGYNNIIMYRVMISSTWSAWKTISIT